MQELQQINCIVGYLDEYDASALQESHLRAKLFSFPLQVREQLLMGSFCLRRESYSVENLFHSTVHKSGVHQTAGDGPNCLITRPGYFDTLFFIHCEFASKAQNLREPEKKSIKPC